jgi:hypothetical protein
VFHGSLFCLCAVAVIAVIIIVAGLVIIIIIVIIVIIIAVRFFQYIKNFIILFVGGINKIFNFWFR